MKMFLVGLHLGLLIGAGNVIATAPTVTLTFDELLPQPVNGVSISGVTFGFKIGGVDSLDATYSGSGPGTTTWVQDPSLEGNAAGILTLDFDAPTPLLQFGVALSTALSVPSGVTVSLFDSTLAPLGVFAVNLNPLGVFTEGQFTYDSVPVGRAVIDFNELSAERFAFDNLAFAPVPEPSTFALVGLGSMAWVLAGRRRWVSARPIQPADLKDGN